MIQVGMYIGVCFLSKLQLMARMTMKDTMQALYDGDRVRAEVNGEISKDIYLQRGLRQGCSLR